MAEASCLDGLQVLVVDDDATMRAVVCRMLRRMKVAATVEADSGEDALERIAAARDEIDLIICDWTMPGMSGVELFQQVNAGRPNLPFLMLTGRADPDSVITAERAGVPSYVVKPISAQELKAQIVVLLGKSAAHA